MIKTFEEFINESIKPGKLLMNLQDFPEMIIDMEDNDEYQWNIRVTGFDFSRFGEAYNKWKEFLDALEENNVMEICLVNVTKGKCYRDDMIGYLTEMRRDIKVSKDSNNEVIKLIVPVSEFEDDEFLGDLKYICTQEFTDNSAEEYGDDEDEDVNPLDILPMYFTDKNVVAPFAKLIDRCMSLWDFETVEDAESYMGYEDDMKKFVNENPEYKEAFDDAINHLKNDDLNGCIFDYVQAKMLGE